MKLSAKITDRDLGGKALMRRLRALDRQHVDIGVQGSEAARIHAESTESVGAVAYENEFGTHTVPPRPFLAYTFDHKQWAQPLSQALARVIDGAAPETMLQSVGAQAVKDVQATIDNAAAFFAPLAPVTLKTKTGSMLNETGQLRESITYKVGR